MTLQVLYSSSSQAPCSGQELTTASLEPCPGMGTAKGVFGAQRPYKELCLSQCCFHWDKWETFVLQDQPYGCIHKSESCVPSAPVAYRTVLLLCPFHVGVDVPGNSFIAVVFIYRWCCNLKNTAGAFLHRSSWMWTLSCLTNLNLCELFQYLLCAEKKKPYVPVFA